jgi:hypothetical protein
MTSIKFNQYLVIILNHSLFAEYNLCIIYFPHPTAMRWH